jgi:hypothetical protein
MDIRLSIYFGKNVLGYILGDAFQKNSSGHPASEARFFEKSFPGANFCFSAQELLSDSSSLLENFLKADLCFLLWALH